MTDLRDLEEWSGAVLSTEVDWPRQSTSRVYDLAVRLEQGMTHHPAHPPYSFTLVSLHERREGRTGHISGASEMIVTGGHVGTHIDAVGHVAVDGCVFGDRDIVGAQDWATGVGVGSVEELAPIAAAGHLVDGEALFGRELTPADGIGAEEFERWFAARPTPQPGSVVLVRTGRMKHWHDPARYLATTEGIPGVSVSGAEWLLRHGVVATGADTVNYEHKPELRVVSMGVHSLLLVGSGVPIMECLNLERLAEDRVYEFFFTASPLRIGGATGSPIRPLAFAR